MRSTRCLSCFAILLGIVSTAAGQQGVRWQPNLEAAGRLAAQQNRLVLVHFWGDGCPPCMQMERDVFSRPDVAAAIDANYIAVKINTNDFPNTAKRFGITKLPTDLVISPSGETVYKSEGGYTAANYMTLLNRTAAAAHAQRMKTVAQVASGPAPGASTATPVDPKGDPFRQPAYAGNQPAASGNPRRGVEAQPAKTPDRPVVTTVPPTVTLPTEEARGYAAPPADVSGYRAQPAAAPVANQASPDSRDRGMAATPPPHLAPKSDLPGQRPTGPVAEARPPEARVEPTGTAATEPRPGNPPLGLDGCCPVHAAEDWQWIKGSRWYGVIHRGRTYLFAGPEERNKFQQDPDRYAPMISGNDIVAAAERGELVQGTRDVAGQFKGRVYLFSNEASYEKFCQDPAKYAAAAQKMLELADRAAGHPAPSQDPATAVSSGSAMRTNQNPGVYGRY
jgi:protein disulfide-isomerase